MSETAQLAMAAAAYCSGLLLTSFPHRPPATPEINILLRMLRVQRKVLVREPLGCQTVQLTAAGSEQGGVS